MPKTPVLTVFLFAAISIGLASCATNGTDADEDYVYVHSSDDEVVCRRQRVVGSHLPRQVCRTRAQIEREQQEGRRSMDDLRTMGGNEPRPQPRR